MSKIFLVNEAFLKKRLQEKIDELYNELKKCSKFCEELGEDDEQTNVEIGNMIDIKGQIRALKYIFNECFSQKNSVEISPSDLELLKKLIKYCFEYGIVDDSDDSLTSIHLKALLKKLESLT